MPNDIEPSIFDGKKDSWAQWEEEVEDYAEAAHGGLEHALDNTLKISEYMTEGLLNDEGGLLGTEWGKCAELHFCKKEKPIPTGMRRDEGRRYGTSHRPA